MESRHYCYDTDDVRNLFGRIIASLGSSAHADEVIFQILADVCGHFRFGCGFVYETDYTGTLHLKERFVVRGQSGILPKSFKPGKPFSIEEVGDMLRTPSWMQEFGKHSEISAVMLEPIFDDDAEIIGLVGMMDRRKGILMDERSAGIAKMVLNLLGNGIKTRILQRSRERIYQSMESILNSTGIDIYVNDFLTHEILYVNKSMAAHYGGLENMLGKKCWQALYTDKSGPCDYCPQKKIIDESGNPTKVYSWDYQRPLDGAWFRVLSAAFRWIDGRLAHIVSSVDITEKKKYEETIVRMANYDALTNLPNRYKLQLDYEEIARTGGDGAFYLLFFDLNKFKALNDGMGHGAGDELLIQIGKTLMEHPLTANHAYRHGGDEFVLFYHGVEREYVRRVVDFLLARFERPWQLKNTSPVCRASIGVAAVSSLPPGSGDGTLDAMLHEADLMMYKAKRNGCGSACFTDGGIVTHNFSAIR